MKVVFLALSVLLVANVAVPQITEETEALSPELAGLVAKLDQGTVEERITTAVTLAESRDVRVLPYLAEVLKDPAAVELHPDTSMAVLRSFPGIRNDFFFDLYDDPVGRIPALHIMGYLLDDRVMDTLKASALSSDKAVREAAAYGLRARAMPAIRRTQVNVFRPQADRKPVPKVEMRNFLQVRAALVELATSGKPLDRMFTDAVRMFSGRDGAEALVEHFAKTTEGENEIVALVRQLFRNNRHWLGKVELPLAESISYSIDMRNLQKNSSEPIVFSLQCDRNEFDLARSVLGMGIQMDRVLRVDMPMDVLVVQPGLTDPRITDRDDSVVRVRYDLPMESGLRAGIRIFNQSLVVSILPEVSHAVATVDTERGVPLSEVVYGADGGVLGRWEYDKYERLADGSWVPMSIVVDLPQGKVGSATRHVLYQMRYQVVDGVWLLAEGRADGIGETDRTGLGSTRVTNVQVTPAGATKS